MANGRGSDLTGYSISDFLSTFTGNVNYMGNSMKIGVKSSVVIRNNLDKPIVIRNDQERTEFEGTWGVSAEKWLGWTQVNRYTRFVKNITIKPGKSYTWSGRSIVNKQGWLKANTKTEVRPILSLEKVMGMAESVLQPEYPDSDPVSGDKVYLQTNSPPPVNDSVGGSSGMDDMDLIMMIVMLILGGTVGYGARGAMTRTALGF